MTSKVTHAALVNKLLEIMDDAGSDSVDFIFFAGKGIVRFNVTLLGMTMIDYEDSPLLVEYSPDTSAELREWRGMQGHPAC